jgi:hypothetical protein
MHPATFERQRQLAIAAVLWASTTEGGSPCSIRDSRQAGATRGGFGDPAVNSATLAVPATNWPRRLVLVGLGISVVPYSPVNIAFPDITGSFGCRSR